MPKVLTQAHLAVYHELMEWRRIMYEEQKDLKNNNTVLGIAGEAWQWASLTEGDKKFIAKQVEELFKITNIDDSKSKVGVTVTPKDKLEESDLTV